MDPSNRRLFTILGMFAITFAAYLQVLSYVESELSYRLTSVFVKTRALQAYARLPKSVVVQKHGLFFGSSELEGFFDTRLIDAELKKKYGQEIRSYNLGLRSAPTPLTRAFVAGLVNRYQERKLRAEYVIFKLPYVRMTEAAEKDIPEDSYAAAIASFHNREMIQELFAQNPSAALEVTFDKLILRGLSRGTLIQPVRSFLDNGVTVEKTENDDFFSLWKYRAYKEFTFWNPASQGLYAWNMPLSNDNFKSDVHLKQSANVKAWGYRYFERCCDQMDLKWSENYLRQTVETIRMLKQISDHVIVVHIPEEPSFSRRRTPVQNARLQAMLGYVSEGGKNKVLDFRNLVNLEDSDYLDLNHLNERGFERVVPAFASAIASELAK